MGSNLLAATTEMKAQTDKIDELVREVRDLKQQIELISTQKETADEEKRSFMIDMISILNEIKKNTENNTNFFK